MSSSQRDYSNLDSSYYPIAVASCVGWLTVYKFISPKLSAICLPGYKLLPRPKQIEWNTRIVSDAHAVLVSLICLYSIVHDDEITKDPVWADSPVVRTNCAIVIGYMMSDTIVMLLNYSAVGEIFYIFHHFASMYAYFFVISYSSLCWFANFRLIAEFSTPFVNQRWFLDVLGYPKTSPLFMVNGVAMSVMFFLVRILSIPPYWHKVWTIYGSEATIRLGNIWYVLLSTCFVLDTINVYWFNKIYKGAMKILQQKQKLEREAKAA